MGGFGRLLRLLRRLGKTRVVSEKRFESQDRLDIQSFDCRIIPIKANRPAGFGLRPPKRGFGRAAGNRVTTMLL